MQHQIIFNYPRPITKEGKKILFLDPLAMNVFFFTMDQAFEEIKWIHDPDENLKGFGKICHIFIQ